MKEIESLEKVYYEIAVQTQTPLSLAMGWIERLKTLISDSAILDTADKTLRQLRKLEITFNRMALYAAEREALPFNQTLLDVAEVIDAFKEDLPTSELSRIAWQYRKKETYIQGDLFQLRFCIETILSYLLRFLPEDDQMTVRVRAEQGAGVIEIACSSSQPWSAATPSQQKKDRVAQAVADIAFGQRLIDQIILRHGGTFTSPGNKSADTAYRLAVPLSEGGHHAS